MKNGIGIPFANYRVEEEEVRNNRSGAGSILEVASKGHSRARFKVKVVP